MSREVDQRIVQMRFDNAEFERNVQKSLNSLDKLNASLQMKGAEKGFEKIQDASEELDFVPAMNAVEKLGEKFSALEVIGVTTLVRLTNKVIDAGERMVKSLSIDNITDGWNKYAQKTASVQTIVNATGKTVRQVNGYLDKLMWYADETSYGFNDMTASLGQLTAAGGDIDKVIPMIMGIANATAYAGKGASEFSRVIYNLNQSYSQGYLSLMDWKSVELAGVATAELKQLLIDTAVEMGNLQEGEVTVGTFASTLSNRWADKTVMETGFGKLAEFTEAVQAAQEAYEAQGIYKTASEVIDELADHYDEAAVKAFRAAQEAKSFAEAMDATKEAVASGWLNTFEIIFGSYDEAKSFWTGLANELYDLFAGGAPVRNSWLQDIFDSGLDKMARDLELTEDFDALLQQVLLATGTLTEQDISDAGGFAKALKLSNVSADELAATVGLMIEQLSTLHEMSDEELSAMGTDTHYIDRDAVDELLEQYLALGEAIQNGEVDLASYADELGRLSGRDHFFNGILNILKAIGSVTGAVGDAFGEVFYADGSGVYKLLEGFEALTGQMILSERTADKLRRTFKGLFSILNIGLKGLGTAGKIAGNVLGVIFDLLSPAVDLLLDGTAALGDWLTAVDEALGQAEDFGDVLEILGGALLGLLEPLEDVWNGFWSFIRSGDLSAASRQFEGFGAAANVVVGMLEKLGPIGDAVISVFSVLLGLLGGAGMTAWNGISGLLGGMGTETEDFKQMTLNALEWITEAVKALPKAAEQALASFGETAWQVFVVFANACNGARLALVEFFNLQNGVDLYRLLALIDVGALALAIWGVAKAMKALNSSVKAAISNPLSNLLNSLKGAVDTWKNTHTANNFAGIAKSLSVSVAVISASLWMLSTIEDGEKLKDSLHAVFDAMMMMTLVVALLANIKMNGIQTTKILGTLTAVGIGMAGIGLAMNTVYSAVAKFGEMDTRALDNGVNAVWHIGIVLTNIMSVLSGCEYYLDADFVKMGVGLMLGAGAITIIANAVIKISAAIGALAKLTDGGKLFVAAFSVGLVLLSITAVIGVITKVDWGGVAKATLSKVPGMLSFAGSVVILAAGVAGMAGAVYLLVNTCKKLSEAVNEDGGQGLAIALVSIIGILGSAKLLELANTENVLKAAGSTVLIAGAMLILAQALRVIAETLAGVDTGTAIAACTVGVVGLMALLAVVNQLPKNALGKLDDLTGIALKLAGMLMILTPALKLLGMVSFSEAMTGVVTVAGILATLMGVGALMGNFPLIAVGLEMLSVSLKKLAEAFSAFAGGALKAALFVGAFAILSNFAGPICEAITTAAPDIEKALVTIVQVIANVLVESAPYLVTIITTVFAVLWESIIGCIAYMWEGDGSFGIKYALDDLFGNVEGYFDKKINSLGDFIFEKIGTVFGGEKKAFFGLAPKDGLSWADILLGEEGTPTRMFGKGFWLGMESNADPLGINNVGEMVATGLAEGAESQQEALTKAGTKTMTTLLKSAEDRAEISSPSKVTYQDGVWIALGLANGLTSEEGLSAVRAGALTMVQAMQGVVTQTLGIHSPSTWFEKVVGFFSDLGYAVGLVKNKDLVEEASGEVVNAALEPTKNLEKEMEAEGEKAGSGFATGWGNSFSLERYGNIYDTAKNALENSGIGDALTSLTSIFKPKEDDGTGTGTGITVPTGSEKTLAEQIEEEYKKKLDANKLLSDTVNEEYELWKAESQYSASSDELLAKKAENAAANIQHQSDRVAIAQAKYDKLTSKWGKDKEETKEAYLALLEEKTALADLKANQYVDIFEEVAKRYDTDLSTLEKEYGLWTAQNESSASKTEKIHRETEYLTEELAVREKQLTAAEEQYKKLADEVGKEDERSREAYLEWLDAQTEYQNLKTEIAQQELELIEAEIEAIRTAQSLSGSRLNLLQTAFDDGELKNREDAYKSAVEEYGEDSKEAREAQWQGTTSSIIGVMSALKNLNAQMEQTVQYENELAKGLEAGILSDEDVQQLEANILSSQGSFLGYAGNLADSFGMEDAGKRAMLKLAYAVQKNWKPLSEGFGKALQKVENKVPGFAKETAELFQAAFDETTIEIGAEIASTISYTVQGDWANALASAMTAAMDVATFASSDAGQKLGEAALNAGIGLMDMGENLVAVFTLVGQTIGSEGILAGMKVLGDGIMGIIGTQPELLAVVAIIAALSAGIAGIVALVRKRKASKEEESAKDAGIDYPTEYAKGIREGSWMIEDAVKGMTETANAIATETALTLDSVLNAEEDYSPCITPVVDLTNVWDSADEVNGAFGSEAMTLDSQTSTRMAGSIQGKQNIQNGVVSQSNAELLSAINGLGAHMDGVAENIKGMQMVVDGNKAIGYIDTKLGERARRNTR